MVTLDEVRARVQAAADRQIQSRAELAAEVAQSWKLVESRRADLESATAVLNEAVKDALAVMSADELAEFADLPKSDLQTHVRSRQTGSRNSRQRRAPAGKPAKAAGPERQAVEPAATVDETA